MVRYEHGQRGTALLVVLLGGAGLCAVLAEIAPAPPAILLVIAATLVMAAHIFSSLTVQITDQTLRWQFGPGVIRKEVPLSEIQAAEVARTRWTHGWGIHWTRSGWLYNVSGLQAVAVRLKSGKEFRLGTDEPERLRAAIVRSLG